VNFVVDAQLPPGLAAWIVEQGHEAQHIFDLEGQAAPDNHVWLTAIQRDAIIISKDRDFVEWALTRMPSTKVVWVRIGNATNRNLLSHLALAWREVIEALERGDQVVEVGRR
jgi:predicted nuclease of predicted toxin-antitoxin system